MMNCQIVLAALWGCFVSFLVLVHLLDYVMKATIALEVRSHQHHLNICVLQVISALAEHLSHTLALQAGINHLLAWHHV